jgi:hypothetical protein
VEKLGSNSCAARKVDFIKYQAGVPENIIMYNRPAKFLQIDRWSLEDDFGE